ncbi:MAG: Nif3-like dinuclear metal center hexameric protein [Caldisericaceae bacterium]
MKVKDLVSVIDSFAPFSTQESYDNSGIQCGDVDATVNKILVSLDATASVVDEAIQSGTNTILTHHPPLFFPIKRIVKGDNEALFKAIVSGINIISAHTNFDLATNGLNDYFCKLIGIEKISPIVKSNEKLYKIAVYVPKGYEEKVATALFEKGAGNTGNYSETSFSIEGTGTFKPLEGSEPFIGTVGRRETVRETKIETIVRERNLRKALSAIKEVHPYEEPAIDVYEIKSDVPDGIGAVGELHEAMSVIELANAVKTKTNSSYLRLIGFPQDKVKRVAVCTGSGGSLIKNVENLSVDLFLTGDLTYHQALELKERLINTIDIEHFDSEKFFVDAMTEALSDKVGGIPIVKSSAMKSPFQIV